MGFDLHGMNPQANTPKPTWDKGDPFIADGDATIVNPQLKEEYDDFIKSKWEWQEANDGAYFRNNVWFWRPLWNFVTGCCGDILSEKDIEQGYYNDGHKIGKLKAKRVAGRLRKMLEGGHVELVEAKYKQEQEQLSDDDWDKS